MIFSRLLYWASCPVVGAYTGAMLDVDVRWHARLARGPKIIAANHPSTTDPFFVAASIGEQPFILIKDVLFQVPLLGEYLRRSGHIPVIPGLGRQAVDAAAELLRDGRTIIIFPEGELSPLEGGFNPARTGVARLALQSGAPVIPIGIHLLRERIRSIRSVVRGQVEYGRWYLQGPYNLTIGKPLHFYGDIEDRPLVRGVANTVMHTIIELAHESRTRMGPTPSIMTSQPAAF